MRQVVFVSLWDTDAVGERRHLVVVMEELAAQQGFKIVDKEAQPIADQWRFVIEAQSPPTWPSFVRVANPWGWRA
jgi:hypothetical protein